MVGGVRFNICDILRRGEGLVCVGDWRLVLEIFSIQRSSHGTYLKLVLFDQSEPGGFVRTYFCAENSDVEPQVDKTETAILWTVSGVT